MTSKSKKTDNTYGIIAKSAKKKIDNEIFKEQTSALATQLAQEFMGEARRDLKAKGHTVEALEKKYQQKQKTRVKSGAGPEFSDEPSGGPSTRQHPELPISEGIAPDNVIIPEAELSNDAEMSQDLKQQYKLRNKLTVKEELRKKHKQKLKQAFKHRKRAAPRPPAPF